MTRILVTGGGGFLGVYLGRSLATDVGCQVTLVDNWFRTRGPDESVTALCAQPNVRLESLDLTQRESWDRLRGPFDAVYHLAAVNGTRYFYEIPHEVLRVNLLTVLHLTAWLEQQRFSGKLLFASSSEVYAGLEPIAPVPVPTPETVGSGFADLENPRISYAVSKLAGELCVRYAGAGRWRWTVVRYHNVYGPRMGREHVIPTLCERLARREDPLPLYGGDHRRAFCHVQDAIQATRLVMESPQTDGHVVNIGNDTEEIAIHQLADRLMAPAGYRPRVVPHEGPKGSVLRRCPDLTKLRRLVGFAPTVGLDEGLHETYRWYAERVSREPQACRP